jgi:predicted RNase H-like HicB family nuclease/uncharacterized damage-inducible protein DinB
MARYPVYLEIGADGRCFAHVLALPGCIARALTRDEALRRLPLAIVDHLAWLRSHDEPVPLPGEAVEIEVAGEISGTGPFDPGSAAALFPPDYHPVTLEEMDRFFGLMAHSREDLLALVQDLPGSLLDWLPHPGSFTIRQLLRHVANAEEWYVSRLVPPETLPVVWQNDQDLSTRQLLDMSRRTAMARLRLLSEEERSGVSYPTCWTNHPEEGWTVRKALRRFVEHEREHTAQVQEILSTRRDWLLAQLATERSGLLASLLGLGEHTLSRERLTGQWTAQDLLAHLAGWDRWLEGAMRAAVAGSKPDFVSVKDVDAANATFVDLWRGQSLDEVLAELQDVRAGWTGWMEGLPPQEFHRRRSYGGYDWSFDTAPLEIQWTHDAEHRQQILTWRQDRGAESPTGPASVLQAALAAAHEELLRWATLVPAEARTTVPVCGHWTPQDLVGHVADWEWLGASGLHLYSEGQIALMDHVDDIDAWNRVHVEAGRQKSWQANWDALIAARQALLQAIAELGPARWQQSLPFPWGGEGTVYQYLRAFQDHGREHAGQIRAWLATGKGYGRGR